MTGPNFTLALRSLLTIGDKVVKNIGFYDNFTKVLGTCDKALKVSGAARGRKPGLGLDHMVEASGLLPTHSFRLELGYKDGLCLCDKASRFIVKTPRK